MRPGINEAVSRKLRAREVSKLKWWARLICAICGTAALSGCTWINYEVYTQPEVSGGKYYKKERGFGRQAESDNTVSLELPAQTLSISVRNRQVITTISIGPAIGFPLPVFPLPGLFALPFRSDPELSAPLTIVVGFGPLDPEGDAWSFDPAHVSLQTHDGRILKPSTVHVGGKDIPKREGSISLLGISWVKLDFDTPASPSHESILSIEGLAMRGKPFPVPPIHLRRGYSLVLHDIGE